MLASAQILVRVRAKSARNPSFEQRRRNASNVPCYLYRRTLTKLVNHKGLKWIEYVKLSFTVGKTDNNNLPPLIFQMYRYLMTKVLNKQWSSNLFQFIVFSKLLHLHTRNLLIHSIINAGTQNSISDYTRCRTRVINFTIFIPCSLDTIPILDVSLAVQSSLTEFW